MKNVMVFTLLFTVSLAFNNIALAQTMQELHHPEHAQADHPMMLEEMAQKLEAGDMTPEMMKEMAGQMRKMVHRKGSQMSSDMPETQTSESSGGMSCGKKMKKGMYQQKGRSEMKGMPGQMMLMMPEMESSKELKKMGMTYQMRSEMMKAYADILQKYGEQLTQEEVVQEEVVQEEVVQEAVEEPAAEEAAPQE